MRKNKKATAFDVMAIIAILIAVSFGLLLWSAIHTQVKAGFRSAGQNSTAVEGIFSSTDRGLTTIGNMFPFILIMLNIVAVWFAWRIKTSPGLLIIALILIFFSVLMAVIFSNLYQQMILEPTLAVEANKFLQMTHIMSRLPIYALMMSLLILFALHASQRDFT